MGRTKKTAQNANTDAPETKKRGAPRKYDRRETTQIICDLVAKRHNLNQICRRKCFPAQEVFRKWITEDEELNRIYARAIVLRSEARADRIDEINRKLLAGKIDANTARVAIDAEKWQAGKENPRRYGDKLEIEHKDGGMAQALVEASERAARLRIDHQAVDAEVIE